MPRYLSWKAADQFSNLEPIVDKEQLTNYNQILMTGW